MEELQLVRNQLAAPVVRTLTDDEQFDTLIDIWSEVKLLTGAILHNGDMLQLQLEVIRRFLATSRQFSALTTAELKHAFYLNAQGELDKVYRHYNKELNAEFIGDVLLAYLNYKRQLYAAHGDDIRGLIDPALEQKAPPVVIAASDWQTYIQEDYDRYRAGKVEWIFGIPAKYCFLRRAGLIEVRSMKHWRWLYGKAMEERHAFGRRIPQAGENRDAILEARRIYDTFQLEGWIPVEENTRIIFTLRKQAYLRFFWFLEGCGVNQIFSEVQHKTVRS